MKNPHRDFKQNKAANPPPPLSLSAREKSELHMWNWAQVVVVFVAVVFVVFVPVVIVVAVVVFVFGFVVVVVVVGVGAFLWGGDWRLDIQLPVSMLEHSFTHKQEHTNASQHQTNNTKHLNRGFVYFLFTQ
eukprot:m.98610 g.98610  ORF g.98610 m.98610 type:complete len:131 (+) comp27083_c1_seq1:1655-2047(+)